MKTAYRIILYGMLGVSLILYYNIVYRTSCSRVIEYDVGEFDERFGLSQDQFINSIELAELPWEKVAGENLFIYKPGADFKINLIFSEQQEKIYEGDKILDSIDSSESSIKSSQQRYNSALQRYENSKNTYESLAKSHEKDVSYWNARGGAPATEYAKLQKQSAQLQSKYHDLKRQQEALNRIVDQNNIKVNNYNNKIGDYNNLFEEGKEFDAGNTDRTEINIYSYTNISELNSVLVHEFGHVLGIDHLEDPYSVMHYLLTNKNTNGEISEYDAQALRDICRLK